MPRARYPQETNPLRRKRTTPGVGIGRGAGNARRIVILFDGETFGAVRRRAVRERTSFAETVRTLVEWGLEVEG